MLLQPTLALQTKGLSLIYPANKNKNIGPVVAVNNVDLPIVAHAITAIIGPSGCGKSTLLRCLNRMNDTIPGIRYEGKVLRCADGVDLIAKDLDVELLRRRIGMVFQSPNPFRKSIFKNIAWGLRIHGLVQSKNDMDVAVEENLRNVGLWEEVRDRLYEPAKNLSGGQQQRLCIARTIAIGPEIILMDEPCSALDSLVSQVIEEMLVQLKERHTIVIVTHNMEQAKRVSDYVVYMQDGEMLEYGRTDEIFRNPKTAKARKFIEGKIG